MAPRLLLSLILVAGMLALPGLAKLGTAVEQGRIDVLERWVPCSLLMSAVYLALSVYGWQLPDRSSMRAIAMALLAGAAILAAALAFGLYVQVDHSLITWLDAGNEFLTGAAQLWCLAGWLSLSALSFAFGRLSYRI
jgi:hypothetical protein